MTRIERRRYDMLIRLRNFGASHAQLFPDTSPAHAAFAVIATEVDLLESLDVAERSASQAARVARKAAARQALADTLVRAGSTARVLARANATVDAQIDLPLPNDDLLLLTLARQFAASAAPSATQFAAHGIPLAEVDERVAAFEQALHERGMRRNDRIKARAEIAASFQRAMDAVDVLDVTVANVFTADPVALAVWKHDRRVGYPRSHAAASKPELPAAAPASEPQPGPAVAPAAPAGNGPAAAA